MAGTIDDSLLKQFFKDYPSQSLSTEAKFWSLPDLPTYQTIHLKGDVSLTINGASKRFEDGAFVFKKPDGSLDAMPTKAAWGGGITVKGQAVESVTFNPRTYEGDGNMASLTIDEQAGRLRLQMPGRQNGASFNYPAPTAQEIANSAEARGAVIQARSGDKIIEGFFTEGKGGVLPTEIGPYHDGISLKGGEFLSIYRNANGEVERLFPYKPYTPKDIEQVTNFGKYSRPGNDVSDLKTLDGQPLIVQNNPRLNVESGKGITPRGYAPQKVDLDLLREQYVNESVRGAQLKQQLAEKFPNFYGTPETTDVNQLREAATKAFDAKTGTLWGQRALLSSTDELMQTNNSRALQLAKESGVELPKTELSELKLTRTLAPEADAMASRSGALLGETAAAAEGSLGKSLWHTGRIGLFVAGAALGTAAVVKGVEYLSQQKAEAAGKESSLKLPDLSIERDGNVQVQGMRGDIFSQAHAEALLQKSSGDHDDSKKIEPVNYQPRG